MNNFFSPEEEQKITDAITQAELQTSGEIRVHVETRCWFSAISRAKKVFEKLEMHRTELKNGVLIYVAIRSKKFAIIGDTGINEKVGQHFWDSTKEEIEKEFRNKNFGEGIVKGVQKAGEQLRSHFPHQQNDNNELSNNISFGK